MENLLQLATQMMLCLVIAAIIGAIVGYLIGKISKCGDSEEEENVIPQQDKEREEEQKNGNIHHDTAAASAQNGALEKEREEEAQVPASAIQKNFETIEGDRPPLLSSPRDGIPDDLKEISGIGLKIEDALNDLGIYHYDQIAGWTPENIRWIDNYLNFKGRVNRENWVGQAKILAAGMPARHKEQAQAKRKKQ